MNNKVNKSIMNRHHPFLARPGVLMAGFLREKEKTFMRKHKTTYHIEITGKNK
jgi:hypothetical protein